MNNIHKSIKDAIEPIKRNEQDITDEVIDSIMRVVIDERRKQDSFIRMDGNQWQALRKALK